MLLKRSDRRAGTVFNSSTELDNSARSLSRRGSGRWGPTEDGVRSFKTPVTLQVAVGTAEFKFVND
jgi:hypothetical protein